MPKARKYTRVGRVKSMSGEKFDVFINGKNKNTVYAFNNWMSIPFSSYDIEDRKPDAVISLATCKVKTHTQYRDLEWYDLPKKTLIGIGCQLFNEDEFNKIKKVVAELEL